MKNTALIEELTRIENSVKQNCAAILDTISFLQKKYPDIFEKHLKTSS